MCPSDLDVPFVHDGYRHVGITNNIRKSDGKAMLNDSEFKVNIIDIGTYGSVEQHNTRLYAQNIYNNMPLNLRGNMPDPPGSASVVSSPKPTEDVRTRIDDKKNQKPGPIK